jgi:uridine phosphorylase
MMDFLVREVRAVVEGPMVIMRFGTCGTVDPAVKVGTIAVCAEAVAITRNVDAFSEEHENGATTTAARPATDFYYISRPVKPDPELHDMLKDELKAEMKTHGAEHDVIDGMNAQGDSFYGSQGRTDPNFIDHNETLIDELIAKYPKMTTLEMESFHLLHLGQVCKKPIKTAAATIILAQRKKGDFLPNDQIKKLEAIGGEACLRTLSKVQLDEAQTTKGPECVWNNM